MPFFVMQGLVGFCLAIQPTSEDMGTIRQNFMTGYRMVFDRENHKLGWSCSSYWNSRNTGLTFDPSQHVNIRGNLDTSPSFLVQQGFLADRNMPVIGQQPNVHHTENSFQVKAETFPETSYQNTLLPGHFDQEDLMSALLKHQQEGSGGVQTDFGFDGYSLDHLPI
ncbi:hypothetical protein POM88_013266 [Heracleum sosnowskyi]|uniref:Uncharacterized protein n=1 Tax=Heracleum sosnowskyi TaxID=360622 RepID=A0AAD8J1U3_9APIA|nr:hypothetical protein POM88_013266 [Heracleum sosnowskyi]